MNKDIGLNWVLVENMFNSNIRKQQEFIVDTFLLFLTEHFKKSFYSPNILKKIKTKEIINIIADFTNVNKVYKENYRIFHAMVCRSGSKILNRASIDASGIIHDEPIQSGFLDNIFNYHNIKENDPRVFVEKLRILLILKKSRTPLSALDIVKNFVSLFDYSPKEIEITLALLERSKFIKSEVTPSDILLFTLEGLGEVTCKTFSFNNNYIENYFYCSYFPSKLIERYVDSHRDISVRAWVVASIANYFIVLQLIKNIEDKYLVSKKEYILHRKMQEKMTGSIRKILTNDFKEIGEKGLDIEGSIGFMALKKIDAILASWN